MPSFAHSAETFRIEGNLLEKGTRKPLAGVNVYCIPDGAPAIKATSDAKGHFAVEGVPEGGFRWVVNLTGYERYELGDAQYANEPDLPRTLRVEKTSYQVYETTVYGKGEKRDAKTKSLSAAQFNTAGSGGDPVKAVQNLPGVNRAAGFSSQVIIEGSAPNDTKYTLDGLEIPIVFHFGGLSSVVMPEALDRVDYLSAGFGPEFGRTNAGLVGLWTRSPQTDRLHGMAYVDSYNAGGMVEGPIGEKSSFLFGLRQSYIGFILKNAAKNNPDFNLTAAPDFSDTVGMFQSEITPIDTLKILSVGSLDTFSFVLTAPIRQDPAIRGEFSTLSGFYRLLAELTHKHGSRTTSRFSVGYGKDWIRFDTGDNYFHLITDSLTMRGEVERKMTDWWRTFVGFDNRLSWSQVSFQLPHFYSAGGVPNPFSVSQISTAAISQSTADTAVYWRNTLNDPGSPWTFGPGLRVDHFALTGETIAEPRLSAKYAFDESFALRSALGYYAQPPQPQEVDATYGNPDVKAPRAWHGTLGVEKDFRGGSSRGWSVTSDLFYKYLQNLVIPSTRTTSREGVVVPLNFTNDGHGRAFGVENQVRYDYAPWSGWISYTLSRSTRWSPDAPEALFAYDQTHLLTVIGAVDLGRNWRLSSRLRFVTGDPYTPVLGGTLDADNDVYIPNRGPYFSQRLDPFFQLDLRVDKKIIDAKVVLTVYLDIQNVTNNSNVEAIRNSYDYSQVEKVTGLPIFPTLGLKGEF